MTAERWAQIRRLYDAALEQPAAERGAFVRGQVNGDADLGQEALAMLRNSSEDGGLLDISLFGQRWIRPAAFAQMLRLGQTLAGRYRILRPIGAGGMGEVYEAEDLELEAHVAVKTMRVEDAYALAHFKREIHLARRVTHPNVCRIFDLHRHHGPESGSVVTFLTMELVEGETLTAYLARRGALTPAETLPIARQIGAALAAAHEKGVVHRDLKSGNVMLSGNGQHVVVTDFGLAHTLTEATESSVTIAGTPAYMAPEQFEGKPVTRAADIYAFGVLLYEMVVGRRPFAGDSPIALALDKIRKEPPRAGDAVPSLPPVWSDVIRRCMDAQPDRRFADVNDALNLLQKSVDRPPVIRLNRIQRRIAAGVLLLLGSIGFGARLYTLSTYVPSGEALRLYRSGAHAQQLGLPWKASQLYEQALARDERFIASRVSLAEAWMDLDQPARAATELQRAAALRPRWRRVSSYESLLELKNPLTARALDAMRVSYRIVVEPPEFPFYSSTIDIARILQLPFANLGLGSIPARNWVWEHAISEGYDRHWIMDDNIGGFCRLNANQKIPVADGSILLAAEDYTDRFSNVPMSGLQYRFFAVARTKYAPIRLNTRVYSCILLSNKTALRWRGRYNEDTDLSLRFLKAGYCTILFNTFLQNKIATMNMSGGNTDELYSGDGRLEMAKSLQRQHPDVCRISRKWGRWQHHVDYRPFAENKLRLRADVDSKSGINDYGMRLVTRPGA